MKLIVGLGNPGRGYANNRHNTGFMCVNHFARTQGIKFDRKQGKARIGMGKVDSIEVILARPQTYMNESGQAVSALVKRYNISLDDLIIIHDDLDLPVGKIRIRRGGSSAGHKGIKSIVSYLERQGFINENEGFIRIRVGIGRPIAHEGSREDKEAQIIEHVLNDFTPDEKKTIAQVIPRVSEAILCLLTEGLTAAMNKYN